MSAAGVTLAGRSAAERLMVDTVRIFRGDTDIYAGKARIQTRDTLAEQAVAGAHTYTLQRYEVHVPVSVTGVQVGDAIEVTAATLDDSLTGRTYIVSGLLHKSHATAQRLTVTEVAA